VRAGVTVDDKAVLEAFRRAPDVMFRHVINKMLRGGNELWREMQRNIRKNNSMLDSNLVSSGTIKPVGDKLNPAVEVKVGAAYAVFVEEGSKPGGMPNDQTLEDWIKRKQIEPLDPSLDMKDLMFLIGRKIFEKGIPAKPFAAPALESKRGRIFGLINEGVESGLKEAFG
jgi:bacteriophage HK97-gp10 putative tail-component